MDRVSEHDAVQLAGTDPDVPDELCRHHDMPLGWFQTRMYRELTMPGIIVEVEKSIKVHQSRNLLVDGHLNTHLSRKDGIMRQLDEQLRRQSSPDCRMDMKRSTALGFKHTVEPNQYSQY